MVKIVRNKTIEEYERRTRELDEINLELQATIDKLTLQNTELTEAMAALEKQVDAYSHENSLTLKVSDDLQHVIPNVRVKKDVFEKMVELGYLDDTVNSETKPFAMQLALMHICMEALEQIISSFESKFEE